MLSHPKQPPECESNCKYLKHQAGFARFVEEFCPLRAFLALYTLKLFTRKTRKQFLISTDSRGIFWRLLLPCVL
jgi:hypothetical protein